MQPNTDDILAAELKKLAVKATKKEIGAGAVSWVARQLPDNTTTVNFQVDNAPEQILRTAFNLLSAEGRIERGLDHTSELVSVSGVVGSGFLGLNPAVVTVFLEPLDSGKVEIVVTGVAKEGVIKQRGGEKAARKIADMLKSRLVPHHS